MPIPYDREAAIAYAHKWAFRRNPEYYNFSGIGGDCANFASQCLYAGTGRMNYTPVYGWFYNSIEDRAPAWSSVKYLHKFLTTNDKTGPYGCEVDLSEVIPGDIIQISTWMEEFHHTLIVVDTGEKPNLADTLIACHSYDSDDRPLGTYDIKMMRCIHIEGAR